MDKIRVFWCHDLPEDPESKKFQDKSFRDQYHKFVFISNWQMQRYQLIHGIPMDDKCIVLESGIEPDINLSKKNKNKIHLVYTSTPQRGLDILVPVFKHLAETQPDIHLEVYSSFKIYGWDDADKQFEPLYNEIQNHPQMTYHGFVPNEELKANLSKYHIFAYPCTWLETSCRAMLEAMSARLVCVHPNNGALPETSGGLNMMYQYHEDKQIHAATFAANLNAAIDFVRNNNEIHNVDFNKVFVDSRYNIQKIKVSWEMVLKDLLQRYPTAESRNKPKEMFTYRT